MVHFTLMKCHFIIYCNIPFSQSIMVFTFWKTCAVLEFHTRLYSCYSLILRWSIKHFFRLVNESPMSAPILHHQCYFGKLSSSISLLWRVRAENWLEVTLAIIDVIVSDTWKGYSKRLIFFFQSPIISFHPKSLRINSAELCFLSNSKYSNFRAIFSFSITLTSLKVPSMSLHSMAELKFNNKAPLFDMFFSAHDLFKLFIAFLSLVVKVTFSCTEFIETAFMWKIETNYFWIWNQWNWMGCKK